MDHKIRDAVPSDAARIEELFVEMLRSVYHTEDVSGYEDGYLTKFFDGHEDRICLAEIGSSAAGYLSVEVHREKDSADFIYLDDLSVSEPYRNNGIGTALIETAERYASALGISEIALHVEKANTAAFRLYTRLGFVVLHEEQNRLLMKKQI